MLAVQRNGRVSSNLKSDELPDFETMLTDDSCDVVQPANFVSGSPQLGLARVVEKCRKLEMDTISLEEWTLKATWGVLSDRGSINTILKLIQLGLTPSHIDHTIRQSLDGSRSADFSSWGKNYPAQLTRETRLDPNRSTTIIVVARACYYRWATRAKKLKLSTQQVWSTTDIQTIKRSTAVLFCHYKLLPKLIDHVHPKRVVFANATRTDELTMASGTWFTWYLAIDYDKLFDSDSIYLTHLRSGWALNSSRRIPCRQLVVGDIASPKIIDETIIVANNTQDELQTELEAKLALLKNEWISFKKGLMDQHPNWKQHLKANPELTEGYRSALSARHKLVLLQKSTDCTICLSEPIDRAVCRSCMSKFCGRCISNWLAINPTCPNCRSNSDIAVSRTKYDVLKRLLENGLKTVVFSQKRSYSFELSDFNNGKTQILYIDDYPSVEIALVDQLILTYRLNDRLEKRLMAKLNKTPELQIYRIYHPWE